MMTVEEIDIEFMSGFTYKYIQCTNVWKIKITIFDQYFVLFLKCFSPTPTTFTQLK